MNGYDPAKWHLLFQSAATSSGALAGLIFIGLSANIGRLVEFDKKLKQRPMIGRAREALIGLLSVLVIGIVALTPGIPHGALAALIILTAAVSAVSPVLASLSFTREALGRVVVLQRLTFALIFSLCLLACGVTLAIGHGGGLFWLPAIYIIAIVQASGNSWVLVVEIGRGIPVRPTRDRRIIGAEIRPRPAKNRHSRGR